MCVIIRKFERKNEGEERGSIKKSNIDQPIRHAIKPVFGVLNY